MLDFYFLSRILYLFYQEPFKAGAYSKLLGAGSYLGNASGDAGESDSIWGIDTDRQLQAFYGTVAATFAEGIAVSRFYLLCIRLCTDLQNRR